MASERDESARVEWILDEHDRQRLLERFGADILRFLQAIGAWPRTASDRRHVELFAEWAQRFREAGDELDICAANCHAVAGALRAWATGEEETGAATNAALRLRSAAGRRAVLTRTTIGELAGRELVFEYIDGANAIVKVDGEYWGTPLDRVLVVGEGAAPPTTSDTGGRGTDGPAAGSAAFRFRLRCGEISNAIQFLTMTGRSGTLELRCASSGSRGRVVVREGRVASAEFAGFTGIDAVARMMRSERIEADFRDGQVDGNNVSVGLTTEQLLIEAAVMADELAV